MVLQNKYKKILSFHIMTIKICNPKFYYDSYKIHHHKLFRSYSINTNSSSLNYCLKSVEQNDYENFLCTLLLPNKLRNDGIAIRAFNVEIATIQDRVTENHIGQMRFKFWEDTIDKLYKGIIPDHPVCIQLAQVVQKKKISKLHLKRMISARKTYMMSPSFFSMREVEEYSDLANTPVYFLMLECAGIKNVDADHACSHLGKAQGLMNMLRSIVYFTKKGTVILPQELLLKYNVSQEDVLRHKVNKNMKDVTFEMATKVYQHLEKMKNLQKKIDRTSRCIFLSSVAIESYLQNLRAVDFNIFNLKLQQRNNMLSLKLLWRKLIC